MVGVDGEGDGGHGHFLRVLGGGLSCALETCSRVLVALKLFVAMLYSKRYELFVVCLKYIREHQIFLVIIIFWEGIG